MSTFVTGAPDNFTENGVTFPDQGCVVSTCDYERFGREGLSICYCEARMFILDLEAAGLCTNCGRTPECECHANGCPRDDGSELELTYHVCKAALTATAAAK